jgi:hypothetical protein
MSKNENVKFDEHKSTPQKLHKKKEIRRYTGEKRKITTKLNEQETGIQKAHGKKTRRNFRHAPNRQ